MSTYYTTWLAAQATQDKGILTLLAGAIILSISWAALVLIPQTVRPRVRIALTWFIVSLICLLITLLRVGEQ